MNGVNIQVSQAPFLIIPCSYLDFLLVNEHTSAMFLEFIMSKFIFVKIAACQIQFDNLNSKQLHYCLDAAKSLMRNPTNYWRLFGLLFIFRIRNFFAIFWITENLVLSDTNITQRTFSTERTMKKKGRWDQFLTHLIGFTFFFLIAIWWMTVNYLFQIKKFYCFMATDGNKYIILLFILGFLY